MCLGPLEKGRCRQRTRWPLGLVGSGRSFRSITVEHVIPDCAAWMHQKIRERGRSPKCAMRRKSVWGPKVSYTETWSDDSIIGATTWLRLGCRLALGLVICWHARFALRSIERGYRVLAPIGNEQGDRSSKTGVKHRVRNMLRPAKQKKPPGHGLKSGRSKIVSLIPGKSADSHAFVKPLGTPGHFHRLLHLCLCSISVRRIVAENTVREATKSVDSRSCTAIVSRSDQRVS